MSDAISRLTIEGRKPDDCHPRRQLKEDGGGNIELSNSKSVSAFADKFIVQPRHIVDHLQHFQVLVFKKKTSEERAQKDKQARGSQNIMTTIGMSCVKRKIS